MPQIKGVELKIPVLVFVPTTGKFSANIEWIDRNQQIVCTKFLLR